MKDELLALAERSGDPVKHALRHYACNCGNPYGLACPFHGAIAAALRSKAKDHSGGGE